MTWKTAEVERLQRLSYGTPICDVFNLAGGAPYSGIRKAYLRLSLAVHPDKAPAEHTEAAAECMKFLANAHTCAKLFAEIVVSQNRCSNSREVMIPSALCVLIDEEKSKIHISDVAAEYCRTDRREEAHSEAYDRNRENSDDEDFDTFFNRWRNDNPTPPPTPPADDDDDEVMEVPVTSPLPQEGVWNVDDYGWEDVEDNSVNPDKNTTKIGPKTSIIFKECFGSHGSCNDVDKSGGGSGADECHDGDSVYNEDGYEDGSNSKMPSSSDRRKAFRRRYRKKAADVAKEAIELERAEADTWMPRRCSYKCVEVGHLVDSRWKCERLCREQTAWYGIPSGVNILQTLETVRMTCRTKQCPATMRFNRQPRSGMWKLNEAVIHRDECIGNIENGSGAQYCAAAYTAKQMCRLLQCQLRTNPNISTREIATIIKAKQIYRRQPSQRHYRAVRAELMAHMTKSRAVQMAAMGGYMRLLRDLGHTAHLLEMTGVEMKAVRVKSAKFIFEQSKKAGLLPEHAKFDADCVVLDDISDASMYYAGFVFVPNIARHMCDTGRKTCSADAAHCQGVGPQSYGTTFEVVSYDGNNHVTPLCFAHYVGTESAESWETVFNAIGEVDGFDVAGRVTVVDQEKGIDCAYRKLMRHATLFLDVMHLKKIWRLRSERKRQGELRCMRRHGGCLPERWSTKYALHTALVNDDICQSSLTTICTGLTPAFRSAYVHRRVRKAK